tara:strand:+ start:1147 stop:1635 length:489 start_codon:yes stop_codon:yes gene_type:complete
MPQRLKQVMQERKLHRHIECQHLFTKAIEVFCKVNRIDPSDLYAKTRRRPVVEARSMIWKYVRERTNFTYQELGDRFEMSHCTVQHHIKNHNDYLERINKKTDARVNELYAITYGTGRDVLNHYFEIPLESEMREMKWRLVIMVDEYPIWTNHQVIEKERII